MQGNAGNDVIRGEEGDDILLGGDDIDGGPELTPKYDYIYGGEGDDAIFGMKSVEQQYLLGG